MYGHPPVRLEDASRLHIVSAGHYRTGPEFDLARPKGHTVEHLIYTFRRHTGVTPLAYVRTARIGKAQELLREGALSVKQVGRAVGYPSLQHFSAVFKQATGFSPRNFVKRQKVR